jgi:glycosyltransferase involved in cell wall biosynthesis
VERSADNPQLAKFVADPPRMLRAIAIVLKSPGTNEKGVLNLNYSHFFPLFARLYDVERVAERYHIVLEPSWSGYCNPDVLCYTRYRFPVFVQAYEPRDREFIDRLDSNLVSVPVSANWWVDHEMFRPQPGVEKDIDVVMIASWARFKRHHRFFAALRKLRSTGPAPRVVLIGYPIDLTRDDILELARYYGVGDLVEAREWVPPAEVAQVLARSKVNVIWSRREGVNRAIIEGMFAGVPCILREGFNYGYHYPYINDQTGCFATEAELPATLRRMIDHHREYSPREWVMQNMSCIRAAQILGDVIRKTAEAAGETWTRDLVPKVNRLHDMDYLNEEDRERFADDYAFLRSAIRPSGGNRFAS